MARVSLIGSHITVARIPDNQPLGAARVTVTVGPGLRFLIAPPDCKVAS